MPDCEKYFDLISAYIDGELPDGEKDGLLSHLASCERCRAVYDTLSSVSDELRENMDDPPEGLLENVMTAVRSESGYPLAGASGNQKKRRAVIFRRAALAAACLAVVILAVPTLSRFGHMGKSDAASNAAPAPSMTADANYMRKDAAPADAPAEWEEPMTARYTDDSAVYDAEPEDESFDSSEVKNSAPTGGIKSEEPLPESPKDDGAQQDIPPWPANEEPPGTPAPVQIDADWEEVSENMDGGYDVVVRISGELPSYFSKFRFTDGADGALRYAVIPLESNREFLSDIDFLIDIGMIDVEYFDAGTQQALIIVE